MDAATTASIRFTETKIVDDHRKGTAHEERYEEGKIYTLPLRSADRWVKRGVAVFASEDDAAKAAGASSDVSLRLQDRQKEDFDASRVKPVGVDGGAKPSSEDVEEKAYKAMSANDLKSEIEKRGIPLGDAKKKEDLVKLLERDDAVSAAVEAKDWDVLHVEELKSRAEGLGVDISAAHSKAELVEAFNQAHPKTA